MNRRQTEGAETIARLREWTRGQAASERLAARLLRVEGYKDVDPSHPLGGQDGLKDVVCERDGVRWIGAAFFPRGQQPFGSIKDKFRGDLAGVSHNGANGIAFVTNQELTLGERDQLILLAGPTRVDLLHLERVASVLDAPACYGIRLEFLDIEMTKEEQLAFFAERDAAIGRFQESLDRLAARIHGLAQRGTSDEGSVSVPLDEIREFKSILDSIAGEKPFTFSYFSPGSFGAAPGHMSGLSVPLDDLRKFAEIVDRITGSPGLSFSTAVSAYSGGPASGHVSRLHVPLDEIREYEAALDRIIAKRRQLPGG